MEKMHVALELFGLFAIFCAGVAKALPPGKAQQAFAFLGSFSAPKPLPEAEKKP